jgi:hypothetical protein
MRATTGLTTASYISSYIPLATVTFPIISIEIINLTCKSYAISATKKIYDFDVRIIVIEKIDKLSDGTNTLFGYIMTFIQNNPCLLTQAGAKSCEHFGTGLGRELSYDLKANEYSESYGGQAFYVDVPTRIIE